VTRIHSPSPYPKSLPVGVLVQRIYGGPLGRVATVHGRGMFSVAWRDGLWDVCGVDDVRVVVETKAGAA
jgi:hypothetical protein